MRSFENPVALHQVHALQRNVQPRIVRVAQEHKFAAMPVRFNLTQPLELPDAVVHVNDKVARLEFGKITEKTGGADFVAGPLDRRGHIEEVRMTINGEV